MIAKNKTGIGVPEGIEALLRRASADPDLRTLLLESPLRAAELAQVVLTVAESAVLAATPSEQLQRLLARVMAA